MKITFLLFGENAVNRYQSSSTMGEFLTKSGDELQGGIHIHNPKDNNALKDLMEAFNGWIDYQEISRKEYNLISKKFNL